jgi:hypothetical protein
MKNFKEYIKYNINKILYNVKKKIRSYLFIYFETKQRR